MWRELFPWHLHVRQTSTVLYIHKSTPHLYLKENRTKSKPTSTYRSVCIQKNQHGDFSNFKSQCSVTKHIIPLIKLTYYTYEWYCLNTLQPRLLGFIHSRDICRGTWNHIHTLYNPSDLQKLNHYDYICRKPTLPLLCHSDR